MNPPETIDGVSIVEVTEVGVREFRVRFTGADSYRKAVEVRAYGRLIGHWFPAGALPAAVSPRPPVRATDDLRQHDPRLYPLRPGSLKRQPAPTAPDGSPLSQRQQQRDEWLRKISRTRTRGTGY